MVADAGHAPAGGQSSDRVRVKRKRWLPCFVVVGN